MVAIPNRTQKRGYAVNAQTQDGKRLIFACECGMIAPYGEWYRPGIAQITAISTDGTVEVDERSYVEALKKQAEEKNHNIKFIQSVCPFCERKGNNKQGGNL